MNDQDLPKITLENQGATQQFQVYHDTLLTYIQSAVEQVKDNDIVRPVVVLDTPALPPNTVRYAKRSDQSHVVFMTFKGGAFDITYHNQLFPQIPYPKLVFGFKVSKNLYLTNISVAVYQKPVLRRNTPLYRFPYSNVYMDGKLCYYSNESYPDLVALESFPDAWIHTDNGDHLYTAGQTNNTDWPLRQVFEQLQGKNTFPKKFFVPMSDNHDQLTFQKWSDDFIND